MQEIVAILVQEESLYEGFYDLTLLILTDIYFCIC
jgi:hypothetical protein